MRKKDNERRLRMMVAYLEALGVAHTRIAKYMGITEKRVSNLAVEARKDGFVATIFHKELCTSDELAALKLFDPFEKLLELLRKLASRNNIAEDFCLQRVNVAAGSSLGITRDVIFQRVVSFAAFSAPELIYRIAASNICGVTWGFTVAKVVDAIGRQNLSLLTPIPSSGRMFIATCGEPYSMEPRSSSSSVIAQKLNAMQGGDARTVLTLSGIPAFIPLEFESHREVLLPFIHEHTGFGRIFGSSQEERSRAIISKLDTVITSVGAIAGPPSTFHEELVRRSGYNADELEELSYGDIGGASIERHGLTDEQHRKFERMAKMWIGITHDDLRSVVERAAKSRTKKPGVIVVTIGENKARIVYEAVRQGLVSELFIDQALAFALMNLCENPPVD